MEPRKKIVVVDDDEDVLEQLSQILGGEGYEVHMAASQAEGEELLLSLHPDLAIVDLMMEEQDSGFVLAHYMKKLYPDVPVIMLTGVTSATRLSFDATAPESRSWVKADRILDKPVRAEQVKELVARLLGRRRHGVGAEAH
ncbi:MAG TPA: response regulator [Longimicrobiales bacterium]|nr:response regulator [Longimicrobiales bacterium]